MPDFCQRVGQKKQRNDGQKLHFMPNAFQQKAQNEAASDRKNDRQQDIEAKIAKREATIFDRREEKVEYKNAQNIAERAFVNYKFAAFEREAARARNRNRRANHGERNGVQKHAEQWRFRATAAT